MNDSFGSSLVLVHLKHKPKTTLLTIGLGWREDSPLGYMSKNRLYSFAKVKLKSKVMERVWGCVMHSNLLNPMD